ncbi:MAG: FAD/NAD(P)-binding oxidoreductase [Campylobacterota bacterium]|nr:FAD/NAD(P)-binding oxidoreductase [Campylobacterota bacterium]
MKKILILGGGFAGVEAAIFLRKEGFSVTLISNRDYFYIYPTSIWVPTGESKFEDVCVPLKDLQKAHGFELIIDDVESIKSKESKVYCKNSTYEYEFLVVAMGSGKMKHEGSENFLSICGAPEDSIKIKEKIDELIKKGSGKIAMGFGGNPKDPSNVRGGPAFEVLFNVHNQLKKLGIRDNYELTFFAPMAEPGARMGKKALKMMDMFFNRLNINKHFGKKMKRFESDGIVFEDDTKLESDFTMFIPAGNGHDVFANSDLPLNDAGLIRINDYCEVKHDFDESPESEKGIYKVFAIGDSAAMQGPDWKAKQGHIAEVMARNVAFNINQMVKGSDARRGYEEHINILCVMDSGDGAAFVYRDHKGGKMIPMPIVGHWLKKGWGVYCKLSKLGKIPRIPGM